MTAYLIRRRGQKQRAHIWLGSDTACRMASTGGLKLARFEVTQDLNGKDLCQMCQAVVARDTPP